MRPLPELEPRIPIFAEQLPLTIAQSGSCYLVEDCVARFNLLNGIRVNNSCPVVGNESTSNSQGTPAKAGILVMGSDNRIEGNHLAGNSVGIQVDSGDNVIVRNTPLGNFSRDVIASGNDVGPRGSAATSTSPWANIWKP